MSTENANAGTASDDVQTGLFARSAEAPEGGDRHDEQGAPSVEESDEVAVSESADATDAAHEALPTAADDEHDGDASEGATSAAQASVDALAGRGGTTSATPQPATSLSTKSRVLADEDEPYSYLDCTVNINLQLLPDDGDDDGREVIVAVSSHIEGPLIELTRLKLLGPLPPLLVELLKQHEERLPSLGAARDEQRQRTTSRTSPAKSKTTVRGANGKTAAPGKTVATTTAAAAAPSGPVKPVAGEQTALFDLMTGRRPKAEDEKAGAEGDGPKGSGDAAETPAASGGE